MKRTRFLALLMTLCLLAGLAVAEGCAICGGDAVCDTCGGLGYLEMKTLSGEMAQVACIGGCVDGKCPDCAVACDICGSDGLCDTCDGLGYLEMKAYGSDEMLQIACTGENCAAGKCAVCGAGAEVAAVEEVAADVPQGSYTFVEPEVEAAVREVLGKETGDITYEDLLSITELDNHRDELTSVEDFQYMTNLTELNLNYNEISDISPLATLTNLTVLDLGCNRISDISPLSGLTNMKELSLFANPISNINALEGMSKLSSLNIQLTTIDDFHVLLSFPELDDLTVDSHAVNDANVQKVIPQISSFESEIHEIRTPHDYVPAATPAPTPTSSPYQAPIVGNDGLHVMSPEEYSSLIEPCDHISLGSNSNYLYRYFGLGQEYGSNGDNDEWAKFERYARALVDSGYYEVSHHLQDNLENSWHLKYIGPQKVNTVMGENAAIIVSSLLGDVYVYYDLDIETSGRANIVDSNPQPNGSDGKEWCGSCGNTGKCSTCHGDKKVKKHVAGTTDYIYQDCLTCFGDGKCNSCGGDGWR